MSIFSFVLCWASVSATDYEVPKFNRIIPTTGYCTLHFILFLCRCDSIQFSVDRRVFIMGFGLYGSSNGSSNYTAQIELKQSFGPVLASSFCKFSSDGSSNTFKVFFDTPVQVRVAFKANLALQQHEAGF